jgi:hypothetical protein
MIAWIILGALLVIGLFIIRVSHAGKRIKLVAILLIIVLIYASATTVVSKNDIKLNSLGGYGKAISLYLGWMVDTSSNLWKVSGDVIKTVKNTVNNTIEK